MTRRIWQELVLVELDKRSLEPSRLAPPQRAVNPLEDLAGRIVIAIIDERVGDERPDTELCAMLTLKGGKGRVACAGAAAGARRTIICIGAQPSQRRRT